MDVAFNLLVIFAKLIAALIQLAVIVGLVVAIFNCAGSALELMDVLWVRMGMGFWKKPFRMVLVDFILSLGIVLMLGLCLVGIDALWSQ